jgi:hypothetical protein
MRDQRPLTLPSLAWAPPSPPRGEAKSGTSFLAPAGRGRGPSQSDGKVRGSGSQKTIYSFGRKIAWIVVSTPSRLVKTSAFQNLNTTKPTASSSRVRLSSASTVSECCPPSNSMMSFASWLAKSAMYPSSGTCLRNLKPSNCRLRSFDQRIDSASVWRLRKARAWASVVSMSQIQKQFGIKSRLKIQRPITLPSYAWAPPSPPRGEVTWSRSKATRQLMKICERRSAAAAMPEFYA